MELYVIRHGESEANLGGFLGGWAQVSLTEQGREDAAMAGRMLKGVHFDRVYASDLIRAVQTCSIALPDVTPTQVEELREINVGDLMYCGIDESERKYGERFRIARRDRNYALFGGESHDMQCVRVARFMQQLAEACGEDEKVAAFCHAGTMHCMLDNTLGFNTGAGFALASNGAISKLRFKDGNWQLIYWNRTEYV